MCEITQNHERNEAITNANNNYKIACDEATKMRKTHPIRLAVVLNFSIYNYEILDNIKTAYEVSKQAFEDAIVDLQSLEDEDYRDAARVM